MNLLSQSDNEHVYGTWESGICLIFIVNLLTTQNLDEKRFMNVNYQIAKLDQWQRNNENLDNMKCLQNSINCFHMVLITMSAVGNAIIPYDYGRELPQFDHGVNLPTTYPLVIAHRGSSGRFPEHTVEGYTAAVEEGADVIECDVTITRDLQLICMHEPWLSTTTDIIDHYPDRNNTYDILGEGVVSDYFANDFTLEELQIVRRKQRYDFRDGRYDGKFKIPTVADYVQVAQAANRPVGIYPETKHPEFINSLKIMTDANVTFEELLVAEVEKFGYRNQEDACFLQSFDERSLRRMSEITELPLVMLLRGSDLPPDDDKLNNLSQFCYGIGPSKSLIVETIDDSITKVTDLIRRAHVVGLSVHAYTFRNEDEYLAWEYGQDAIQEYNQFMSLLLDGYFTDFPQTLYTHLNTTYQLSECFQNNSGRSATRFGKKIITVFMLFVAIIVLKE